jgi:hypothetical protein
MGINFIFTVELPSAFHEKAETGQMPNGGPATVKFFMDIWEEET